jgi:hypothetical protein
MAAQKPSEGSLTRAAKRALNVQPMPFLSIPSRLALRYKRAALTIVVYFHGL